MNIINKLNYPNPIFIRKNTNIINDDWFFSFDNKLYKKINVPFCPESKLSGIGHTDFIYHCYYKKQLSIEKLSSEVVIHFGAVDYRSSLFVNGEYVGSHVGGYTPFEFNITKYLKVGENELLLEVFDNEQRHCPTGKQSHKKESFGCFYTRTTGIWQNVWIERRPKDYIKSIKITPSLKNASASIEVITNGEGTLNVYIYYKNHLVTSYSKDIKFKDITTVVLPEVHSWEISKGEIYDVKVTYQDDMVFTYFGLRDVEYRGFDFYLNNKKVLQKLVLDQGYYPDGIYTPKNVDELENDINIAIELGFNGARLHQKVFDPRFLYLADVKGYLVWGEYPSWGVDYSNLDFVGRYIQEWSEAVDRDYSHPSIITWCPLNEVWGTWENNKEKRDVRFVELVYEFTKKVDPSRPCVDVSGGHHSNKTDLFDFHCYEDIQSIKKYLDEIEFEGKMEIPLLYCDDENIKYKDGVPVNFSEFGGIKFTANEDNNVGSINVGPVEAKEDWGYGKGESDSEAFIRRYEELVNLIYKYNKISGFCYTQLYDVEQECNGFYTYDRKPKLTKDQIERIRNINNIK